MMESTHSRLWYRFGAGLGITLMPGVIIGGMITAAGMSNAFDVLGKSGVGDPQHLSVAIGEVLISTGVGMAASAVGALLFVFCRVRLNLLERTMPPPLPDEIKS